MMYQRDISKYRSELFGIATIMIVVCHSTSVIDYPKFIEKVIAYGGIGVYTFAFLSGIGLYYSMKNSSHSGVEAFYRRRFKRVFLPYLLVAGIWYGIKYIGIEHSMVKFFYELSTLSFWMEHKGAWYVAMLIPLYLVYPGLYNWLEKRNGSRKSVVLIFLITFVSLVLEFMNYGMYKHLSQVLVSVIIFLIGNKVAQDIYLNRYDEKKLLCFLVAYVAIRFCSPINKMDYFCDLATAFLGVIFTIVGAYILGQWSFARTFAKFLRFFGNLSLDMYLCNIFLLQGMVYWGIVDKIKLSYHGENKQIFLYLIVIVMGILLSILSKKVTEKILKVVGVKYEVVGTIEDKN